MKDFKTYLEILGDQDHLWYLVLQVNLEDLVLQVLL